MNWTKEYCGLQYLGEVRDPFRVVVRRFGKDKGELSMVTRIPEHDRELGGPSHMRVEKDYPTVDAAKSAGVRWVKRMNKTVGRNQ
jgi:hypothetical protein